MAKSTGSPKKELQINTAHKEGKIRNKKGVTYARPEADGITYVKLNACHKDAPHQTERTSLGSLIM